MSWEERGQVHGHYTSHNVPAVDMREPYVRSIPRLPSMADLAHVFSSQVRETTNERNTAISGTNGSMQDLLLRSTPLRMGQTITETKESEGREKRKDKTVEMETDTSLNNSDVDSDVPKKLSNANKRGMVLPNGQQRKRKYRKATHTIRKEETERLQTELKELQAYMDDLRSRTLSFTAANDASLATRVSLLDEIQRQQLAFTRFQAMISEYSSIQSTSPIQSYIHLTKDTMSRRKTLLALKARKLQTSRAFLQERCNGLDPRRSFNDSQSYETPEGDCCVTQLVVTEIAGVQSVKQVFDILVSYFQTMEISISEKLGNITIREDDDSHDYGIVLNRLVTTTDKGLLMESNTVTFADYFQHDNMYGNNGECGLITADFIDEDELHPYRPHERIRMDANVALQLTSYMRKVNATDRLSNDTDQQQQLIVVMVRWANWRFHRPKFHVIVDAWRELQSQMDRWRDTMQKSIQECLHAVVT